MKRRNPYAAAHSMRGGAGAGAHRDRRKEILDDLTDPYSPEWVEMCPAGAPARTCDTGVMAGADNSPPRNQPLSREWLLQRGTCCGCGCLNCPWKDETPQDPIPQNPDGDAKE